MLPEFGHYALILALCVAILQSVIPLLGASTNPPRIAWMQFAKPAAFAQFFLLSFSFFCLAYAFVSNDFSVAYVAQNSNTQLPAIYRFCAVWGAHEGSLLLWVLLLSVWMAAVSVFSRSLPLKMLARVLAILAMISVGFLLFMLTTSDPFARLLVDTPLNGRDLNPILQDPGLVSHPPMLYMGYVGFSVAFAFAIAALIGGHLDATWARWSRPWTLVAWCFLTIGIVLGSWWAYRELGWGGWWFWDPVENASFLPWLMGTALIHSLIVTEKRNIFKAWTALLAIAAFSLSLLGTFLVRSGVLVSVHTFAVDPQRGAFMLGFLFVVVGGSLSLYAWRAHKIRSLAQFCVESRETLLLSNNIILLVTMLTVLLGTLYPLIIDALGLGKLSVGAPYFNSVFVPLMLPFIFLLAIGPYFYWQNTSVLQLIQKLRYPLLFAVCATFFLLWLFATQITFLVVLGLGLALWVIVATAKHLFHWQVGILPRFKKLSASQYGMVIAHLGVAVTVIGIVLTTAYTQEREVRLAPGEQVQVAAYQFKFLQEKNLQGPNYNGTAADILVTKNNHEVALLQPEKRLYTVQQMATSKAAIAAGLFRDLYVALGEPIGAQAWSVRIYTKPFVRWIWWGGFLMMMGGIVALCDKRYRRRQVLEKISMSHSV